MTAVMASLFTDVHPSNAGQTAVHDGKCFIIAFTVNVYFLPQMLFRVVEDGSTRSLLEAL